MVRPVTVLGRTLRVAGRARVEASGNVIRLVPTGVELVGGGRIDDTLTDAVRGRVALEYTIPDLPDGVQVESVTPEAGGFRVSVSGTEVTLPAG